ncbi:MAG: tRNA1(Val) (adenine(37)-N6)-methyltransferase [Clostridia bacterium]|nr:tRNA1(Val) (adenine(37)-N6)-methyltransferase [Clostridia bacterium]
MNDQSLLLPGERIDDLQLMNLRIIQSPDAFRFGMDAVVLSDFAHVRRKDRVCDLGTGTGILPLLLYGRDHSIICDAVEIQPDCADRARRSVALNGLTDVITVHTGDLRAIRSLLPHAFYDLVICNPPYSPADASLPSPNPSLRTARQEGECTVEDMVAAAQWLLKYHGRFCLMLPAARLTDAFDTLRRHRIEPKRLRLVHANAARPARLALIEGMLDANPGLAIEPPLLHKNADGTDTDEILRIYHLR